MQSAQRLSASMRLAQDQDPATCDRCRGCSTPFGIYEVGTLVGYKPLAFLHLLGCSTPFGIYEVGTSQIDLKAACIKLCSTPFGIYEVGTRAVDGDFRYWSACSTPFGIYEVGT